MKTILISYVLLSSFAGSLHGAEINVAVASNFKYSLQRLAADFKEKTGHELKISSASSGKLYAQIQHGAPYDIFFSADEKRADLLVANKMASAEDSYIYALGKLVFLSNIRPSTLNVSGAVWPGEKALSCEAILKSAQLQRVAMANPKTAPYGFAAQQVLEKLKLWQKLQSRIVTGENVLQVFQFVSTKNAEAGFVALSTIKIATKFFDNILKQGCIWHVPVDLYSPIKQKMLLLNKAKNKKTARLFLAYMRSESAKKIIKIMGYDVLQ